MRKLPWTTSRLTFAGESFTIPSLTSPPSLSISDAEYAVNGHTHTPSKPTRDRDMDVVYVRSKRLIQSSTAQVDPHETRQLRRAWEVAIAINDNDEFRATITDPFLESEYKSVFEHYLRDSDRPRWSPESMNLTLREQGVDAISQLEDLIRVYGEDLWQQLKLDQSCPLATECHIYIVDTPATSGNSPGIHCLAWELLEAVSVSMPKLRLRVTRISDVPPPLKPLRFLRPNSRTTPSFATVQTDTTLDFHVLLVVARDFSRTGVERDPEPDLAQWPLMNAQRKLRSRIMLEVVRPGSREELEEHLEVRALQGTFFHLVHFDLHGRIMSDECVSRHPRLYACHY
jgi:hypothetical protein